MHVDKLILYVSVTFSTIEAFPYLENEHSDSECAKVSEKRSFLAAKILHKNTEKLAQPYCRPKNVPARYTDSNLRYKREIENSSLTRVWMKFQVSYVVTLVSIFLLILNISLLLYLIITRGKLKPKSKETVNGCNGRTEFQRRSPASGSSTLSTPRLSDEYPTSGSESDGNENSSAC